jgi:hypothetical protein
MSWAIDHYIELAYKYPGAWIAVCNKEVIAASKNIQTTKEIAEKKAPGKQIPYLFIEGRIHVC